MEEEREPLVWMSVFVLTDEQLPLCAASRVPAPHVLIVPVAAAL